MITLSVGEAVLAGGSIAVAAGLVGIGAHWFGEVVAEGVAAAGRRLRGTRDELPAPVVVPRPAPAPAPRRHAPAAIDAPPAPQPEPEPQPEPVPAPVEQAQEVPASVWHGPLLADELPAPELVWLPDHEWHRDPTGPRPVLPPAAQWPASDRLAARVEVAS